MATEYLVVSVPNTSSTGNGGSAGEAMEGLRKIGSGYADIHPITLPPLLVGTLNTLLNLSDTLQKTDTSIHQTLIKLERSYLDLTSKSTSNSSSCSSGALQVGGKTREAFIEGFEWDYAKFPHRRPLGDLVNLIASNVTSVEDELKALTLALTDKQAALTDIKRKKGSSLLVANLSDVLSPDGMRGVEVLDTEYLKSVFVAVPKTSRVLLEGSYETLGCNIITPDVNSNSRYSRNTYTGSIVVPSSLKFIQEDYESCLFVMTVLKGKFHKGGVGGDGEYKNGYEKTFDDDFAKECRDKRFIVKAYTPPPPSASSEMRGYSNGGIGGAGSEGILEKTEAETTHMKSTFTRWCRTHYGTIFSSYLHIKLIRIFIESVLRYGLPVNFTCVVFKVKVGRELGLADRLEKGYAWLGGGKVEGEEEGEEYLAYVCQKVLIDKGE